MLKFFLAACLSASIILSGCNAPAEVTTDVASEIEVPLINSEVATLVSLSDSEITVNGEVISADTSEAVYVANDIIYYEDGTDETYGEGTENDMHSAEEAEAHTVVHIAKPGTYRLSGSLSQGQIFVDLGDGAKNNPDATVTLVLDNVDITCSVAPAVFFYNVYECAINDKTSATATVDTSAAGANIIIADGSTNRINGAYVARIYKPGTADKLHKYDGAFYSKRSMNIFGGEKNDGFLYITAENEGLDSEMHLTVNGGNIIIESQNDGINTNEDNISVTTINGGSLVINAGLGTEGDGIDSNGFLVVNGGSVLTSSCYRGADGGIDADRDIIINGGTVMACGNQNGAISANSSQQFMQIMLTNAIPAEATVKVLEKDTEILSFTSLKSCTSLVLSSPDFKDGHTYTVTVNGEEASYSMTSGFFGGMGHMGGQMPDGFKNRFEIPEVPEGLDKWLAETEMPDDIREWIEAMRDLNMRSNDRGNKPNAPNDVEMPQGGGRPMQPFDGVQAPNA